MRFDPGFSLVGSWAIEDGVLRSVEGHGAIPLSGRITSIEVLGRADATSDDIRIKGGWSAAKSFTAIVTAKELADLCAQLKRTLNPLGSQTT